jgi:iron-sulfur cluster assembly protein
VTTTHRKPRTPLTISISQEAADHVRKFAAQSGKPDTDLRVAVKGGGCSGLTYVLDLEGPGDEDKTIEQHGIRLHVPKKSYVFLAGTVLEYSGGLNGKGFVFNNPNAKTTCGCGTSFSV